MRTVEIPDLQRLEQTLHAEIPLTRAMDVRVLGFDARGLTLGAALAPNLNHKKTAFGGSLNSLATLACWGLIQLLVRDIGRPITVVIQESAVRYLAPVTHDMRACCPVPAESEVGRFLRMLERKGRARLELEATIDTANKSAVRFDGRFVAYDKTRFRGVEPV
jgi:thioesterase domain-containing protein